MIEKRLSFVNGTEIFGQAHGNPCYKKIILLEIDFSIADGNKYVMLKFMNAEEFYKNIMGNPDLQNALEAAVDSGTLDDFLKANGCTASADEVSAYISEHS